MSLIIKIFGIGIIVSVADMILTQAGRKETAFGLTIVGIVLVLIIVVVEINKLFNLVTTMFNI